MKLICENPECPAPDRLVKHGKDRHGLQRWRCKLCHKTYVEPPPPSPKKPNQIKKTQKGVKSMKGKGELYDTPKTNRSIPLTDEGARGIDEIAESLGISRSELVERIGRGIIPIVYPGDT